MMTMCPDAAIGETRTEQRQAGRLGLVDVARGIAVVAMAIYHTGWDLGELRLTVIDPRDAPAWSGFARAVAASFLLLVGVGLVLAHGDGFRARPFWRRQAVVIGAAALVSLVTFFVFPSSWIFFGILHCIAAASLLAVPFLRLPIAVVLAASLFVMALPFVAQFAIFDWPPLAFVGLGARVPDTNDYVPLFPWAGIVLLGIALTRLILPWLRRLPERTAAYPGPLRGLAFLGRHSLLVYLLHQPLIFGLLSGYAALGLRSPAAEIAWFTRVWRPNCQASGWPADACERARDCAIDGYKREGIWPRLVDQSITAADRGRIAQVARECFARDGQRTPTPD